MEKEAAKSTRRLLIADGNDTRRHRLAEACRDLGLQCTEAPHGSAALELALASPPGLVISEVSLPLVDGYKLAEILRANPRTRSARFLFLGAEDGGSKSVAIGETVIPISTPVDEVMRTVVELVRKGDRIDSLEAATRSGQRVDGELAQLPLADLVQVVHLCRNSGRVDVEREGDEADLAAGGQTTRERGFVLLRDGEILQAEVGSVEGEKALFRLLAWRQGRFTFEPGRRADVPPKILAPARALLSEGLRQLAEWDRLALQLPPLDAKVKLQVSSGELPNIVHPLTQEVLVLVEHYPLVRDVVDRCSFPDYQVLRTLHTLAERGIVEIGQAQLVGPGPATRCEGLFDEGQLRRLGDYLQSLSPRGGRAVKGKILVVASEPGTLADILNLMRGVPGIELAQDLQGGREPRVSLGPLANIQIDDDLSIELLQVPASDNYRPLWPIAGHGALGTLFLLTGPVSESAQRVHAASEVLRDLPRTRLLHVVLLGRKDRISPEELRENLSLIDESSLFLLPIESAKESTSLLRSLFSRVVP